MNIYTYFDDILDDQVELIDIWKKSWEKFGWTPIILDRNSVVISTAEMEYLNKLPTVNPIGYDLACFIRWKAMSNHGGWMCDYDVINRGFTPSDSSEYKSLSILQGHVPCLVYGTKQDYVKLFNIFTSESLNHIHLVGGREHTSDMYVIKSIIPSNKFIISCRLVEDYPSKSKLVHCSHGSCSKQNATKKESMVISSDI